jgi:3-deoxy-D-manno-octulosonate 8-phosphate phosphatase (KDO 8-P phosphatase)
MSSYAILERARHIKVLALDVDGILSDGRLIFSNNGEETKAFDVRDGLGMKLVQESGVKLVIITGRNSNIVKQRMDSLGVDLVVQGREDKGIALAEACRTLGVQPSDCAYMGDDWPDLGALAMAGLAVTVPNAHHEVRRRVHLVTQASGGRGAVRELCDMILQAKGTYDELLARALAVRGD